MENSLKKFDVTKRARFHEFWTHSVCSLTGWGSLYVLYINLFRQGFNNVDIKSITANHFILLLIGLLGVIGFLPLTLWGIANTIQFLAKEVTGRLFK